jgi:hypothetical protein
MKFLKNGSVYDQKIGTLHSTYVNINICELYFKYSSISQYLFKQEEAHLLIP